MTRRLDELLPDQGGTVVAVHGSGQLRRRLMTMGLTPGARLVVRKFAPLGDPIEIKVRDYSLSIRRRDAGEIYIECEAGPEQ